jgi:hypothetical protein
MLNAATILLIGFLFNAFFPWRLYPSGLYRRRQKRTLDKPGAITPHIAHEDFVYALSQMDSFIDVNEHDLLRIYELATGKSGEDASAPFEIVLGAYYSNGKYGNDWSVRQIVDASDNNAEGSGLVIYKVVAGNGRRTSGYASRDDFSRWAKYRVTRDEENWKRME